MLRIAIALGLLAIVGGTIYLFILVVTSHSPLQEKVANFCEYHAHGTDYSGVIAAIPAIVNDGGLILRPAENRFILTYESPYLRYTCTIEAADGKVISAVVSEINKKNK